MNAGRAILRVSSHFSFTLTSLLYFLHCFQLQAVTLLYFLGCPIFSFILQISGPLFVNSIGPLTKEEPTDGDRT